MKASELREISVEELVKKITTAEKDLTDLTFKHSLNQLENPMMIRNLRKEIARMKTILSEQK